MDGDEREAWEHGRHRAPRWRRPGIHARTSWLATSLVWAGLVLVTGGSIMLLLSGATLPTKPHGPLILPKIYSVPKLLSPGPAGTSSKRPAPPSTAAPAGRAPGSHPLITPDSPSSSTPPPAPPPPAVPKLAPAPTPATTPPSCPPSKQHGRPPGKPPSKSPPHW